MRKRGTGVSQEKYIAIRIPEELHALAKEKAARERKSLREVFIEALEAAVKKGG